MNWVGVLRRVILKKKYHSTSKTDKPGKTLLCLVYFLVFILNGPNCSVLDGGQWRDSVSSSRINPAINGHLKKSVEGKQEGCAKTQDGWPPPP